MKVKKDMVSPYCKSIGQVMKLVPNLKDKTKYICHYRIFTEKQKHTKNSFEKDFFKLMNESVLGENYGKCL